MYPKYLADFNISIAELNNRKGTQFLATDKKDKLSDETWNKREI